MQGRTSRFNIYLAGALVLAAVCGCQSPEKKASKKPCFFRVHMEATVQVPNQTKTATVFRQAPASYYVEPMPFLNEEHVKGASVVDSIGGFSLQVEFNRDGRYLLEQYTSGNKTRRLLIFSHFVDPNDPKVEIDRWLGAPRISQAITNGMLVFTPDASREEAEQIARGLRTVSKKVGNDKEI